MSGSYVPPALDDLEQSVAEPLLASEGRDRSPEREPHPSAGTAASLAQGIPAWTAGSRAHGTSTATASPGPVPGIPAAKGVSKAAVPPTASASYPPGQQPATGWPAPTQDGSPARQYVGAYATSGRYGGYPGLPDLPDAISRWRDSRSLLVAWLFLSIGVLTTSLFWFEVATLAGILGTVGASLTLCQCCGGGADLAGTIKATRILAAVAAGLSGFVAWMVLVLFHTIDCRAEEHGADFCHALHVTLVFLVVWHGMHAYLSGLVFRRAGEVKRQMDPVTSGMVDLA